MSTVITQHHPMPAFGVFYERTDPALMISTGNPPTKKRNYPQAIPFFRAKPGADGKWAGPAASFNRAFECEVVTEPGQDGPVWTAKSGPKELVVRLPSDDITQILDVRFLAFAKGRLAAKGDTNYVATPIWAHGAPEIVTAYPIEGEPVRFQITGADDPLCLGGEYGIPTDKSGKPTLAIHATLNVTLAEIGALSSITAYQTKSVAIRSNLWKSLNQFATLGPLSSWLFLLRVVPGRRRYRDADGVSHTTKTSDVQLWGPIHGLDDRRAITIADAQAMVDRARALGAGDRPLLGSGTYPPMTPGQPGGSAPNVLEPGGGWAEDDDAPVDGEVVNPDDLIPFGDDDGPGL